MPEKTEEKHLHEIIGTLMKTDDLTRKKAWKLTKSVCKKYSLEDIPTNVQILEVCNAEERKRLTPYLQTKPIRTSSGVTVITVVPKPAECPGSCVYCPRGEDSPQSYIGTEPAIMRARHNRYDPYAQVKNRLKQYELMGHPTDKIQIIIIGGTFLSLGKSYKRNFIKRIFDALNGRPSATLEKAKRINETADNRCIGLIIETRPDFCTSSHINEMLEYGTTMVETGVQSVYPDIMEKVNRIHTIEDVKMATKAAKDAGLKVNYHVMPGLPGVSKQADIEQFKRLFEDDAFKPDALKIYPTLVLKNTKLYDWWKDGEYEPLTTEQAVEILSEALRHIPKYCRIVRMQRTMSASEIEAGVDKSNLRELVERAAEKKGVKIKEIRYREIGLGHCDPNDAKLLRVDYEASGGHEIFLSFEDERNDKLIGFLRLRIGKTAKTADRAFVRELHVYGRTIPIGITDEESPQHRGFGARLLAEAERIAKDEFGKTKITVTSGVGARQYYYKKGYESDGAYVSKEIG